jgi:DNA-binding MarR family transcriptional regulator
MTDPDNRAAARQLFEIVALVMGSVAADLRRAAHPSLPVHYHLLSSLANRPCNLSQLADRNQVSLASMSRSISILVDRGWVRRLPDPGDRRVSVLELTWEGRAALRQIDDLALSRLQRLLAGLQPGERRNLSRVLAVLSQALGQGGWPSIS